MQSRTVSPQRRLSIVVIVWLVGLSSWAIAIGRAPETAVRAGGLPAPKSPQSLPAIPIVAAAADQASPALAFCPTARRYLVVWEDAVNGAALADIRGRLVDHLGNTLGGPFPIAAGAKARHKPRVVCNAAADEFLVVYEYQYTATDMDVYAQRVRSNSTLAGVEFSVAVSTTKETRPVVTHNAADNQYLVVWQSWIGDVEFGHSDIHGRRVDANGALLGAELGIKAAPSNQDSPAVTYLSALNQYLVLWVDRTSVLYPRVYEGRFTSLGAPTGFESNTGFGANDNPNVVYNAVEDEYAYVFENKTYGPPIRMDNYLFVWNLLHGYGWGSPVEWFPAYNQYEPDVAFSVLAGNYAVVWEIAYTPADHDVYMMLIEKINPNTCCRHIGPTIVSGLGSWEGNPAVASGDGLISLVVWEDARSPGNGLDIYGALLYHRLLYLPLVTR